jgi:hypothetical protein
MYFIKKNSAPIHDIFYIKLCRFLSSFRIFVLILLYFFLPYFFILSGVLFLCVCTVFVFHLCLCTGCVIGTCAVKPAR